MAKRKITVKEENSLISKLNNNLNNKVEDKEVSTDITSPIDGPDYDAMNDEDCECEPLFIDNNKPYSVQTWIKNLSKNDILSNENIMQDILRYADAYTKYLPNGLDIETIEKRLNDIALNKEEKISKIVNNIDRMKNITKKVDDMLSTYIPKSDIDSVDKSMDKYEMVNHPKHYNNYDKEVIDMIEDIWGTYLAAIWCEITAFKYRMRMGTKPDNDIYQDIKKEKWYLEKRSELKAKLK